MHGEDRSAAPKRWRITAWDGGFIVEAPTPRDALVEAVGAVIEDPSLLHAEEIVEEAEASG